MTGRGLINMNTGLKGINFNLKLKTEKKFSYDLNIR